MNPETIADELKAAVITAAEKAGDVDMDNVRCLKFWGYTSIMKGRAEICWSDSSPEILKRVKKFAAAWMAKRYPGTQLFHVKRQGYKTFAVYFSSGVFDCHGCGLFWRVAVTEETKKQFLLGRAA